MQQITETEQKRCKVKEMLSEMKKVDIRTVNTTTLKDISDVEIDQEKPVAERVASYIDQIGKPYCYKSHGVVVKINFAGERRLEDCIQNCMNM